jgi:hypothetical protein
MSAHLIGSCTPLPNEIGQVVASVGAQTIARWPRGPQSWFAVDIPNAMLQRNTTLNVQVNISGNTGCGEFQPITRPSTARDR